MASPSLFDVAVIGGGVIGASVAIELSQRGASVVIVERAEIGAEASSAAIGGLTPHSDDFCGGALRSLATESVAAFGPWLEMLHGLTGSVVEFASHGLLQVAVTDPEVAALEERARLWEEEGARLVRLDPPELRECEPELTQEIQLAYHLLDEPATDPQQLMKVLAQALNCTGCHVLTDCAVEEVRPDRRGHSVIVLGDGRELIARDVVVAAGVWSRGIGGIAPVPLAAVRGQAALLQGPHRLLLHHIYHRPTYLVPRVDGRLVIGVTYEETDEKAVTAAGLAQILDGTLRLLPTADSLTFVKAWAGLRPRALDGKPVLGWSSKQSHVLYACGHFGLGITLAPVTAQIVAGLIDKSFDNQRIADYSPERFGL